MTMPTTLRHMLIATMATSAVFAATPLRAQSPAVELEGYYVAAPARLTALDARARTGRGINLLARVPETRQQAIDDADPSASPTGRDEATSPLIAHFKSTPTLTRR
jgi:hypothetical protein